MKKNKSLLWICNFLMILSLGLTMNSCKKVFDEPPAIGDPNIVANTSIKALKAMHTVAGQFDVINTDLIISGIVVANDKSGNIYKTLYIQDSTGGIALSLDATNLYTTFPVGRRVFLMAKGLAITDDNRQMIIGIKANVAGSPSLEGIPSGIISNYLVGGSINNNVTPKVVTLSQLGTTFQDPYQSTLIQLNNYEFQGSDTSRTYADTSAYRSTVNLTAKGCGANSSVIVRTSGFANFAGVNVPNGNGTLIAVYTIFGNTKQLILRDTSDVKFTNPRCGQGATTLMNISDLRASFGGAATTIADGKKITGIVISNRATSNINSQNVVLQQGNNLGGILVRFDTPHTFNVGDSIDINVSSQELSEFNNTLQVNNVPLGYATLVSTGKTITPRTATLAQVAANFEAWESTLVKVNNVNLSGGTTGTYSGNVTMNDGSGSLILFTAAGATFSSQTYPSNAGSVTGYLTQFGTTNEISIRSASDVVAGTVTPPPGGGIALTTSPVIINFDNIRTAGLPAGVYVKVGTNTSTLGTADATVFGGTFTPTPWNNTSLGVKNFASATGLTSAATIAEQDASTNRALGFRQTGTVTTGGDPGVAFIFQLDNTTGKTNLKLDFLLQSLDATSAGRTTTWTVDYAIGDNPTTATTVATSPATLTTVFGTFSNTPVTVNFGSALNNINQKVWIRIVALTATTGSGSRASTAVDDVKFTFN